MSKSNANFAQWAGPAAAVFTIIALNVILTSPSIAGVLDDVFTEYADKLSAEQRGGLTIVEWLWGFRDQPSPIIINLLLFAFTITLGYVLMVIIRRLSSSAPPQFERALKWASFVAFAAPTAGFQRVAQLPVADWLAQGIIATALFPIVAFFAGHVFQLSKNKLAMPGAETRQLYEVALNELESGLVDKGLWAQCLSRAKGNKALAKATYLRLRSDDLSRRNEAA